MKKNKTKSKSLLITGSKWFYYVLGILCLLSMLLSYKAIIQPLQIEQKSITNTINQKVSFNYNVEVLPSTLYPQGGIVETKDAILTRIVKSIRLHLESSVKSDKLVEVDGMEKVTLLVIADGLWEREFPLTQEKKISFKGTDNKIIKEDIIVDVASIAAYIQKVEKETEIRPERYLLKVQPRIDGNIVFENNIIPLDTSFEMVFEYSSYIVKPIGEKEFIKATPIEEVTMLVNNFKLFKTTIPLSTAKYLFPLLSISFLIAIIFGVLSNKKKSKDIKPEATIIDGKYGNRLTYLENKLNSGSKVVISLKSFKPLTRISDEKEIPILRFNNEDINEVTYCVIDGDCIYNYIANNMSKNSSQLEVSNSVSAKDISQAG